MTSDDSARSGVIYTRLSAVKARDKQAGKADINVGEQRAKLLKLAGVIGVTVDTARDVFTDNDLTAYKGSGRYKGRPGFDAMIKRLTGGDIGVILVYQAFRLYRSHSDLERLITICKERGISIKTIQGGDIDLTSATGQMLAEFLASVGKQEVALLTERAAEGKARIRAAGRWPGGRVPFGYRVSGDVQKGTYQVTTDPAEAAMIRQMYADVLAGKGSYEIARGLDAAGAERPGKNFPARRTVTRRYGWEAEGIYRMLGNPRYAALVSYQGDILGEGDWPAIIDRATFDKARAVIDGRRHPDRGPRRQWLLSGIAVCGKCGSTYMSVVPRRGSGSATRGYACGECFGVNASTGPVEEMVGDAVKRMLAHPAFATAAKPRTDIAALNGRREKIGAELEEIAAGKFTIRQKAIMSAPLLDELDQVERKLTEAYKSIGLEDIAGVADPAAKWDAPPPHGFTMDQKRTIVRALVRVTILPMSAVGMGPGKGWKVGDKWFNTGRVIIEPRS